MDILFGDATTAMPTPQTRAETGSLMGISSPVPSMDLRRGIVGPTQQTYSGLGPGSAIPGLDIDPPHVSIVNGKPQYTAYDENGDAEGTDGVGGWISRMVNRNRGEGSSSRGSIRSGNSGRSAKYKPLDNEDD